MAAAKPKRGRGRPTKLTQDVFDEIVSRLRSGAYVEEAAESVGVNRATVWAWLKRGREGGPRIYAEFHDAVTRAQAEDAFRDLALITAAASKPLGTYDWRAAAWKRERKDPARWGAKVQVTLRDEINAFLDALEAELPPEWFQKICEIAHARLAGGETGPIPGLGPAGGEDPPAG